MRGCKNSDEQRDKRAVQRLVRALAGPAFRRASRCVQGLAVQLSHGSTAVIRQRIVSATIDSRTLEKWRRHCFWLSYQQLGVRAENGCAMPLASVGRNPGRRRKQKAAGRDPPLPIHRQSAGKRRWRQAHKRTELMFALGRSDRPLRRQWQRGATSANFSRLSVSSARAGHPRW